MERITSRQNATVRFFRDLSKDAGMRRREKLFLCDGLKLMNEAIRSSAEIQTVLWKEKRAPDYPLFSEEYTLPADLFDYVSPMMNSGGPLFSVRMRADDGETRIRQALALEGVQDPGNVGTILRTADAFGIDAVILMEGCADLYSPKTVKASMGAVFRQKVFQMDLADVAGYCRKYGLPLYGAALSDRAADLRDIDLTDAVVAIGSEGRGLSSELLKLCDREIIIPMRGSAESLNAAIAGSVIMWEMQR